jgi:Ran GTPase-activating protein (RanGAP) involved in mRNA processing and transport
MIKNSHIKSLDLGILEGSIRKNSFGIDGARCLAAILLQNKKIEVLRLEDNDIGINGAEIISIPLKRNHAVKELKISENLIKTQGAEYLLNNAIYLVSLDMGKNFIKSSIGPTLKKYFSVNTNLKRLNLELNELRGEGANILFEGLLNENCSL